VCNWELNTLVPQCRNVCPRSYVEPHASYPPNAAAAAAAVLWVCFPQHINFYECEKCEGGMAWEDLLLLFERLPSVSSWTMLANKEQSEPARSEISHLCVGIASPDCSDRVDCSSDGGGRDSPLLHC